jgi:ESCRT-I complex subunit TSG101
MAAVKQATLNWLYSVLTSVSWIEILHTRRTIDSVQEYADVQRTYNDVAQTLSHYSSLSPRTDVYSAHTPYKRTKKN